MKKRSISLLLALMLLIAVVPTKAEAATNVSATVAGFKVTLNGVVMDNAYAQYPLIVYKDITYFPMTYYDCRFMAVKTDWNNDTRTLKIDAAGTSEQYHPTTQANQNSSKITASVVDYNVIINGKQIDNASEPYPLLSYRDVTYFPMTWRFCVDEFGWAYSYTQESGLIVNSGSGNITPKQLSVSAPNTKMISNGKALDISASYKDKSGFGFYTNSADGVCVSWCATNQSGKTINYYTCFITMYNPVGDPAYDQISGKATKSVKVVGPVPNGDSLILSDDIIGYSAVCSKIVMDKIYLEYADGTSETVYYGFSGGETSWNKYYNKF